MANGVELATAYVSVVPEFKGMRGKTRKAFADVGPEAQRAGRSAGEQFGGAAASGFDSRWSRVRSSIGSTIKYATGALAAFGTFSVATGVKTAAAMENAEIAFTTMLGSGQKAGAFLKDLKDFAASTPFEFPELQTASQSLISIGISSDKVIPIMRTLGNVTAGMGTGSEGIKRATIAIQQMTAAQRIQAEDLNQLRDAGIPVYDLLASALGKTKAEVVELSKKGGLGKDALDKMMAALETGKGLERFNGMMEKQSQSLGGMWSTLKDTFTMGMAEAVQPMMPLLKDAIGWLTGFVEDNIPRVQAGLKTVVTGAQGLYNLLIKGDYTGALRDAFGWEEDSDTVDKLFNLRDAVTGLFDKIKGVDGGGSGDFMSTLATGATNLMSLLPAMGPTVEMLGKVVGFLADNTDKLAAAMPYLIGAFITWKTLQAANTVIGRDSAVGMALQIASTIALTKSNFALAKSQRAVDASQKSLNHTEQVGTLQRIRARAATIAHTVAEKARTIATKAGAAAQRVMNAVMRMNPIGMVVTALLALGAGLVLAYKKSETFRRIVDAAWAGVKKAVKAVVDWWQNTAWPAISSFFQRIGSAMVSAKDKIAGAWDSIKAKVTAVKDWITKVAWPALKATLSQLAGFIPVVAIYRNWDKIKATFTGAWNWVKNVFSRWWSGIKKIFTDPVESAKTIIGRILGKTGLQKTFQGARDAIGRIWDGIRAKFQDPLRKVATWIDKNFISKVKSMLHSVKLGDLSKKIPYLTPGGKGYATGGWTGPGSKYTPAGIVHADEFVVRKASRRRFEQENPGLLDHVNRFGTLAGYAMGGKVGGLNTAFRRALDRFNEAAGGRFSVLSGLRSRAEQAVLYQRYLNGTGNLAARPGTSRHESGNAADLVPSSARDTHGALARRFGLHFPVPGEPWHVELINGGKGGGNFFTRLLGKVMDKGASVVRGLLDKFTGDGSIFQRFAIAAMKMSADGIAKLIQRGGNEMLAGDGSLGTNFQTLASGTNVDLGRSMAKSRGWTGNQWLSLKELWARESNWNHRAINSSSGAYGIPQALPASKMASAGGDWRINPVTQIAWGLGYIKQRYGTPAAALAFHNRNNWYAGGGLVKRRPLEFDNGGYLPTGVTTVVNNTGKPEPLGRLDTMGFAGDGTIRATFVDADGILMGTIDGRIDNYQADAARVARMGA